MPRVRAVTDAGFYPEGVRRDTTGTLKAMFQGQFYEVPEDEAERLVAEGAAEIAPDLQPEPAGEPEVVEEATAGDSNASDEPTDAVEEAPKPRRRTKKAAQ